MSNMERLAVEFASLRAIPKDGTVIDGIRWFQNPAKMMSDIQIGKSEAQQAVAAVKSAPDNPFGDDDEAIAVEILKRVKARRGEQR